MSTTRAMAPPESSEHRVVVIGSGFGGLFAAKALKCARVQVTVLAETTHHLFQPLLYQVATGILSEGEIAPTTREVLSKQENARVLLGRVTHIDLTSRTVTSEVLDRTTVTPYDSLIVAAGAGQSYFGHDHFAKFAPGMKTIDDALELRGRIFTAFEWAELASTPKEIERLMTFVIVGAGPTGVEMAGQIAELSRRTLRRDFRKIHPADARIVLLDAASQVLPSFRDHLGERARERLAEIGVEVQLGTMVTNMDATGVDVVDSDGTSRRIEAVCKVWAAGVKASELAAQLAQQTGAQLDRVGRIEVLEDLTLPGRPEVFVIGDMASLKGYPGVAQVAIQGARFVADVIQRRLAGHAPRSEFVYRDKGSMATITRFSAVASIGNLRLAGASAWLLWMAVHLAYIVGFKHRLTTLLHWAVSFVGRGRSERTVTEQQVFARNAIAELGDAYAPSLPRVPEDREHP